MQNCCHYLRVAHQSKDTAGACRSMCMNSKFLQKREVAKTDHYTIASYYSSYGGSYHCCKHSKKLLNRHRLEAGIQAPVWSVLKNKPEHVCAFSATLILFSHPATSGTPSVRADQHKTRYTPPGVLAMVSTWYKVPGVILLW